MADRARATRPTVEGLTDQALDRADGLLPARIGSIPGALAAAGLRGSDFIKGWKRRDEPLDIGLVDETSMLDERQFDDLRAIFPTLVLFGDPAQLAPGGRRRRDGVRQAARQRASWCSAGCTGRRRTTRSSISPMRWAIRELEFGDFEDMVREAARRDDRVVIGPSGSTPTLMARAPVLVWRNATRIRLIEAFRAAHGAPLDALLPGEPLICDGIELPLKHRKKRIDLEARGLIKGAQVIYLGPGKHAGLRPAACGRRRGAAGSASPASSRSRSRARRSRSSPSPRSMGAVFLHGAAVTIHKAQGSQWAEVQVFAPDLYAAAQSGRSRGGPAAVEAARLCRDHAGRGAAATGWCATGWRCRSRG